MENLFHLKFTLRQVNEISNLGLAHIGDAVYELLCRTYLCAQGDKTVKTLHRDSVQLVKATTQAQLVEKILPHLTPEETDFFRRGKNAHSHAAPKGATPAQYAKATGLETLFGALYLMGQTDRLLTLFEMIMKED